MNTVRSPFTNPHADIAQQQRAFHASSYYSIFITGQAIITRCIRSKVEQQNSPTRLTLVKAGGSRMRYIDNWLTGLGLEYIIPKLKDNGINTPKKLAQLTLRDMYEVGRRYTVFIAIII